MKNYLLPFVLILIFSCGKDDEQESKGSFPEKYTFTEFDYGTTSLFEIDGSEVKMIPLSGSFVEHDKLVKEAVEDFQFLILEFIDEQKVNVTVGDGSNNQMNTWEYQTDSLGIHLIDGMPTGFIFEKDELNKQIKLCYNSYWGTLVNSNGDWEILELGWSSPCLVKNTTLIADEILESNPSADTIAINFSNYVFDLVE